MKHKNIGDYLIHYLAFHASITTILKKKCMIEVMGFMF